ncbi:MAG: SAV_2336 N-terminal domain-related protein, partial [Planktothrix sp.]
MIEGLIQGLSKELNLSAEEIADTVWLALQITSDFPDSPIPQDEPPTTPLEIDDLPQSILNQNEDFPRIPLNEQDSPESPSPQEELSEPPINPLPEEQKAEICPRDEQDSSKNSGLSLKIPDASSLREPLTLARALKPLMRRVASGQGWVLDEVATTQQIAEKNIWIPILKPTLEPWLDLDLVVDESISMHIWRSTINELEKLLKNYGIFRDVRIWGLLGDDPEKIQIRRGIGATAKNQSPRSPKELIDPSGRRLVLVVSDCVSSLWRSGKFTPVLELWAKQGLMAIVQMLPKWMWETTALAWASEVRLRGLHPGAFNQNLIAEYLSFWDEVDEKRGVKVPVFTLEPEPALNWAQVLAGKGNVSVAGYVFDLDLVPVEQERRLLNFGGDSSAESRVQGFRVTASPMARRLAGLLASAPVITLPIVRLIQETLLKESRQVNVAEVFLGGLLEPLSEIKAETNPDYVKYDFIEGVRELFLESVPSDYALTVIDEVSKYVAKKLDFSVEYFGAILRNPRQVEDGEIADNMKAFATVTAEVLRGLGGPYVAFAESIENEITANDNQVLEGLGEPDVDVAESIENEIIANDNQVWEGLEEPDVDVAESSENEIIANDNESSNELKQLIKQPDSTKLLFLPPLQQNAGVGTNRPGQWQHRNDVTLDRIAQSLALPKGKDAGNGCSIPDMWARPLWVDIVLTGNASHPLRSDFKAQWKGMLAAIALAKVQGFNLRAQFLDLGRSSQDKFISSLLQLIPPKEKSIYLLDQGKINPWKHIFLFLWNDRPVGMTSPSTLICPSADGDWTGL